MSSKVVHELNIVSHNTAGACGTSDSLASLIYNITTLDPSWDVIVFQEVDHFLDERLAFDLSDWFSHSVTRHWPGVNSFALAIIVHARFRDVIHKTTTVGRAVGVRLRSSACDVSICSVHGAHGDHLAHSLHDIMSIKKLLSHGSHNRMPFVVVGDLNVDQLPGLSFDPFSDVRSDQHHADRRQILNRFLET